MAALPVVPRVLKVLGAYQNRSMGFTGPIKTVADGSRSHPKPVLRFPVPPKTGVEGSRCLPKPMLGFQILPKLADGFREPPKTRLDLDSEPSSTHSASDAGCARCASQSHCLARPGILYYGSQQRCDVQGRFSFNGFFFFFLGSAANTLSALIDEALGDDEFAITELADKHGLHNVILSNLTMVHMVFWGARYAQLDAGVQAACGEIE